MLESPSPTKNAKRQGHWRERQRESICVCHIEANESRVAKLVALGLLPDNCDDPVLGARAVERLIDAVNPSQNQSSE
jgi:hypothetical protein